ncbi:MAG: hypothetical protein HWE26_10845 [Alteromonadaceae bacterium]|nr:hypothetical protein [Alteromonadaceae bacterium]
MVFREKSAWLMLTITLVIGGYIAFGVLQNLVVDQQFLPVMPVFVKLTVSLIVVSVVGQVVLSVANVNQAEQQASAQDKSIVVKAQATAGVVLALGVVGSLILYLYLSDGTLLFYSCLFSLVLGQLVDYALQIVYFRLRTR